MWNCCLPMLIHMFSVPALRYGSRVNPMPVTQKSVAVSWLGMRTLQCSSATMLPTFSAPRLYLSVSIVSPLTWMCGALLHDLQQLHLEDQRGSRLDARGRATLAVRQVGRAHEPALAPDLHHLDALGPAANHAVERKRHRLAPLVRAVEHGAVRQSALVMHLHLVARLRRFSGPGLDRGDHESG